MSLPGTLGHPAFRGEKEVALRAASAGVAKASASRTAGLSIAAFAEGGETELEHGGPGKAIATPGIAKLRLGLR